MAQYRVDGCKLSSRKGARQFARHPYAAAQRPWMFDAYATYPNAEQRQPEDHNQGDTGSCVGNAIAGAMQVLRWQAGEADPELSAAFVYALAREREGTLAEDSGCEPVDALTSVQVAGICVDSLDPLSDATLFQLPDNAALDDAHQRSGVKFYQCASSDELYTAMGTLQVPGLIAISVYPGFESPNADGTITDVTSGELFGYHFIQVRFYDDEARVVRVRNSWGESWGVNDEATLTYEQVDSILQEAWVISALNQNIAGQRGFA